MRFKLLKKQNKNLWNPVYLLIPKIIDNHFIWLEWAERKWDENLNTWIDQFSGYSGADGGFKYKLSSPHPSQDKSDQQIAP